MQHRPRILFLDEPTSGLDPQTRNQIWEFIHALSRDEGVTVFFTTHYMEEAERVAYRIAVIDHGWIVAQGTTAALRLAVQLKPLSYGVDGLRGAFSGGFVFGVGTDFAVLGSLTVILLAGLRLPVLKDRGITVGGAAAQRGEEPTGAAVPVADGPASHPTEAIPSSSCPSNALLSFAQHTPAGRPGVTSNSNRRSGG